MKTKRFELLKYYPKWVNERWFKRFVIGHIKDTPEIFYSLLIWICFFVVVIPYLFVELFARVGLTIFNKGEMIGYKESSDKTETKKEGK